MKKLHLIATILVMLGIFIFFAISIVSEKAFSDMLTNVIIGALCFGLGYTVRELKIKN